MKKAIFIWQTSPVYGGVPSDGGIARVWAARFCKKLQESVKKAAMDWEIELDDTYADAFEITKKKVDLFIFAPGGKTRFYIPKEMKQEFEIMPKVYLEMLEYYKIDTSKVINAMKQ